MMVAPLLCSIILAQTGGQISIKESFSFDIRGMVGLLNMVDGCFTICCAQLGEEDRVFILKADPVSKLIEKRLIESNFKTILFVDDNLKPNYWDRQSSLGSFAYVSDNVLCSRLDSYSIFTPIHLKAPQWGLSIPYPVEEFTFNSARQELAVVKGDWFLKQSPEAKRRSELEVYDCKLNPPKIHQSIDLTKFRGDRLFGVDYLSDTEILVGIFDAYYKGGHQERVGSARFYAVNLASGKGEQVLEIRDIYSPLMFKISDNYRYLILPDRRKYLMVTYEITRSSATSNDL